MKYFTDCDKKYIAYDTIHKCTFAPLVLLPFSIEYSVEGNCAPGGYHPRRRSALVGREEFFRLLAEHGA